MTKLLKLLFVLTGTTTLPLTVIACGQESLDGNLNILYNDDETKYDINKLLPNHTITDEVLKEFSLKDSETQELARTIANMIFEKNDPENKIPWYDKATKNNQKCYNFDVKYGKENTFTWDVQAITGRFTIKISYLVGTADAKNNFVAHQKIDKSFNIKVAKPKSEAKVKAWIDEFNDTFKWDETPLEIDLSKIDLDLPKENTSWSSLDTKIRLKTNETIDTELKKLNHKLNAWTIQATDENIKSDMTLKLQISVNLNETVATTKHFYIKLFKK